MDEDELEYVEELDEETDELDFDRVAHGRDYLMDDEEEIQEETEWDE